MKEESYHLARSLGVPSKADMACGFNYHEIGLLPTNSAMAAKFSKCCYHFRAPEVERDLLDVDDAKLAEASDYHLISVSLVRRFFLDRFALNLSTILVLFF